MDQNTLIQFATALSGEKLEQISKTFECISERLKHMKIVYLREWRTPPEYSPVARWGIIDWTVRPDIHNPPNEMIEKQWEETILGV